MVQAKEECPLHHVEGSASHRGRTWHLVGSISVGSGGHAARFRRQWFDIHRRHAAELHLCDAFGGRVFAIANCGNDGDWPVPCLLAGQDGAGTKAHPAGPAPCAIMDNVALAAAWQDPKPEAWNIVVPGEIFSRSYFGGVNNALGKFGHGRSAFKSIALLPEIASGQSWKQKDEYRGASP